MPAKAAPKSAPRRPSRSAAPLQGGAPAQDRELRLQGTQTLSRLLEAARIVFDQRGFQAARVDDVVKQAKTSHGTFYLYFSNKEDLFAALARETIGELTEVATSVPELTPDQAGRDALRAWMVQFFQTYQRNGMVIRAWSDRNIVDTHLDQVGQDLLHRLASSLAEQVRQGSVNPVDEEVLGMALLAMIERTNFFLSLRGAPAEPDVAIDTLTTVIFGIIFRDHDLGKPLKSRRRS